MSKRRPLGSKFLFSVFIMFLSFTVIILEARAQIKTDTLKATLDEIEIKAIHSAISSDNPPLSLTMQINEDEQLSHKVPITMDDLLNQMPGIWVNDRENYALGERITVRGIGWRAQFGVRGIQVVMDGIPLTMADGQAMLTVVDPIFIRRAELIRGPSSMFWGNSSGGVLYLNTTQPANKESSFLVRGTVGSFGLKKSDIQYTQRFGNHGISGYASYLNQEGYRAHSEAKIGRAGISGSYDLSPVSRLEYFGAYANMPKAQHPSGLTGQEVLEDPSQANSYFQNFGAGKQINQGQFGVSFSNTSSLGFLKATAYGTFRNLNNPLPFAIIDLNRLAAGSRITLQKDFNNISFNFGVESKLQYDDRKEFEPDDSRSDKRGSIDLDQIEKVYNYAGFITSTYSLGELNLLGSIRYDWIQFQAESNSLALTGRRKFQSISPGIGINYSHNDIEFFSNLSTGFEVPTANELSNRPGGGSGFNPNLKPENTLGLELGSRGQLFSDRLTYDVALYSLWISNLLFPYRLENNGPDFYRNQGKTIHKGVEANLQYDFSQSVQVGFTYNLTDAQFTQATTRDEISLEGKAVPGIPEHRLSTIVHWLYGNLWFTTSFQFVSEFAVNNLNTAYNDSYWVGNSRVSYKKLKVGNSIVINPFLAVNNIFDAQYNGSIVVNADGNYYEPAAGVNWRTGISLQF